MVTVLKPPFPGKPGTLTRESRKDLFSFLLLYGKRIIEDGSVQSSVAVQTLYTVPAGKVFFATMFGGAMQRTTANSIDALRVFVNSGDDTKQTLLQMKAQTDQDHVELTVAPCIPVRLVAGESICFQKTISTSQGMGNVSGYEIDSTLMQEFYQL